MTSEQMKGGRRGFIGVKDEELSGQGQQSMQRPEGDAYLACSRNSMEVGAAPAEVGNRAAGGGRHEELSRPL